MKGRTKMNTENLYFGEIREVKDLKENKTLHVDYRMLQKLATGEYKDIFSLKGKTYQTTYQKDGDVFVNESADKLIPYYMIDEQTKEISRKDLKNRLEQLKEKILDEEQLINIDKLFIGYLARVASITYSFDYNDSFIEQLFSLDREVTYNHLKKTLLLKEGLSEYRDIKTGEQYRDYLLSEGDTIVMDSANYPLTPFKQYLTDEEKCKEMPKKKVLSKFQKIK